MKIFPKIIAIAIVAFIITFFIGMHTYNNSNFEETNFQLKMSHDINNLEYNLKDKTLKIKISGYHNVDKEINLTYNQRKKIKNIISKFNWNDIKENEKTEENDKNISLITSKETKKITEYPENLKENLSELYSLSEKFEEQNKNRLFSYLYTGICILLFGAFLIFKISTLTMD